MHVDLSQLVVWLFSCDGENKSWAAAGTMPPLSTCHLCLPPGKRLSQYPPPTVCSIRTMLNHTWEKQEGKFIFLVTSLFPSRDQKVTSSASLLVVWRSHNFGMDHAFVIP